MPTDPDFRSSTVDGGRTQTIFQSQSPRDPQEMTRSPPSSDWQRNGFSLRQPPQIHSCNVIEIHPTPDAGFKAAPSQPFTRIGHSTRVHSTEQIYESRPEENLFQHRTFFEMKRKLQPTAVEIDFDTSFNLHQSPGQQRDHVFFPETNDAHSRKAQTIEKDGSQTSSKSHGPRSTGTRYKVFYRHLKRLSTNRQSRCKRMTAAVHYEYLVESRADEVTLRDKRIQFYLERLAKVLGLPPTGA